jgi:protein phosphatase
MSEPSSHPVPNFDDDSGASPSFRWGAATHPGNVRDSNEDDYVADTHVFAVADGMGGHNAGEVASAIATTTLRDRLANGAANLGVAVAAVIEANAAIFQAAYGNPDQRGMGTTLTGLAVIPATAANPMRLGLVNVGDSRTYVRRNGRLKRATIDHSYVQELLDTGHITEEEARNHPRRNIVTRALGIEPTVRVDSWLVPMVRGDRWVVCSDGLVDEVIDRDIDEVLATYPDPQQAAEALVATALLNGGRDNVTVVVVDVLQGQDPPGDDETAGIPVDDWEDRPTSMIEADADHHVTDRPVAVATTHVAAAAAAPAATRRPKVATLLFALLGALIVVVLVAGTAAFIANRNDLEAPTPTTPDTAVDTTRPTTAPTSPTTPRPTTTPAPATTTSSP